MWMKEITFWIYYWTSLGNVLKVEEGMIIAGDSFTYT